MANEKLIYASDARKAILKEDPTLAYCIDNIKGVDAVEVVRCKDCKYSIELPKSQKPLYCKRNLEVLGSTRIYFVTADHFCSYGERREGE